MGKRDRKGDRPATTALCPDRQAWWKKVLMSPFMALAVTMVFAWLILWLGEGHVLRRCEALSLHLPTSSYWQLRMANPGGLIDWLSTWLTQYLYHPCLGALVYAAGLTLLQWLIIRAFGLRGPCWAFAVIVAMMLLWGVTSLGYEIFAMRTPGIVFSPLVGCLSVAALCCICRQERRVPAYGAVFMAVVPLLYPLLGAYALIAAVICVCMTMMGTKQTAHARDNSDWVMLCVGGATALFLIWGVPHWWIRNVPITTSYSHLYLSALPMLPAKALHLWLPYAAGAAVLLACATADRWCRLRNMAYVSIALAVASMACPIVLRNKDANFHTTVKMELALEEQDYQKAIDISRQLGQEPTRLNVMLGEAALNHQGMAGDWLYAMPCGASDYQASQGPRAMYDAGAYIVSYHMGRLNFAYRWAMEYMVEYGPRVDYLKTMAKCALLNGETELARKHLEVLSQTRNHRAWALEHYRYLKDPEAMLDDPELRYVDQLAHFDNKIALNTGTFEPYLRPTLAQGSYRTTEALDLALQNCLNINQVRLFMQLLPDYAARVQRLPRHYQEAVLIGDQIMHTNVSGVYNIDPLVRSRFDDFVRARAKYSHLSQEEQRDIMAPQFGNTYWYYFVYDYPRLKDKML